MKTVYEKESENLQKLIINCIENNITKEFEIINYVLEQNNTISYLDVLSELQYLCNKRTIDKNIEFGERKYFVVNS